MNFPIRFHRQLSNIVLRLHFIYLVEWALAVILNVLECKLFSLVQTKQYFDSPGEVLSFERVYNVVEGVLSLLFHWSSSAPTSGTDWCWYKVGLLYTGHLQFTPPTRLWRLPRFSFADAPPLLSVVSSALAGLDFLLLMLHLLRVPVFSGNFLSASALCFID